MAKYRQTFSHSISIVFFTFCFACCLEACNNEVKDKVEHDFSDKQKETELKDLQTVSKKIEGTYLDSTVMLENFISGQKISVRQLINEGNKLIFQYSELNCGICVDSALAHFKDFALMYDKRQFVVIAASSNRRYMANFVRENRLGNVDVYLIGIPDFERLYTYDVGMPFVYVVNRSLQIKNTFIPPKEYPDVSIAYYSKITAAVFKK